MADSDKIFNPTSTRNLPQDGKSKGESEQHFETEQAAQALEMVHTLLNWREARAWRGHDLLNKATAVTHADTEMRWVLDGLHPADIAYVLEALPLDDRLHVWGLVDPARDGEILLEVSDSVRPSADRRHERQEMVAAMKTSIPTRLPIWPTTCRARSWKKSPRACRSKSVRNCAPP